jgi:hypothetical protein
LAVPEANLRFYPHHYIMMAHGTANMTSTEPPKEWKTAAAALTAIALAAAELCNEFPVWKYKGSSMLRQSFEAITESPSCRTSIVQLWSNAASFLVAGETPDLQSEFSEIHSKLQAQRRADGRAPAQAQGQQRPAPFGAGSSLDRADQAKLVAAQKSNGICGGFSRGNGTYTNCKHQHVCFFCRPTEHGSNFNGCPKRGSFP